MFKHPGNFLFALLALMICSPSFADVIKWKDENGVTHYGDAPIMAGAERVKIDAKADKENAERIRRQTEAAIANDSGDRVENSTDASSTPSGDHRSPRSSPRRRK